MAIEIERKFLVKHTDFLKDLEGTEFKQGYLNREGATVRVRIAGNNAFLTIKGKSDGIARLEYEYPIPKTDAAEMLANLCAQAPIEKTRYIVDFAGKCWEVDIFHGQNQGLVVAEIELDDANEPFEHPDWLGDEVSHDPRYFNSQLASHPFCNWE
ncbi:MAG: CYTH domain-containing protein [Pseudomonadales bacterium]|jgi:CYTH domain-containing protein